MPFVTQNSHKNGNRRFARGFRSHTCQFSKLVMGDRDITVYVTLTAFVFFTRYLRVYTSTRR